MEVEHWGMGGKGRAGQGVHGRGMEVEQWEVMKEKSSLEDHLRI